MSTERNNKFSEIIISLLMQSMFVWIPTGFLVLTYVLQYLTALLIPPIYSELGIGFLNFSQFVAFSVVIFVWTFFHCSYLQKLAVYLVRFFSGSLIVLYFFIALFSSPSVEMYFLESTFSEYFTYFLLTLTILSSFYCQARFLKWWKAESVKAPIWSTDIDFIEENVLPHVSDKLFGAIVLSFVRESIRLKEVAFRALYGVVVIVILALLAVLYAGLLTASDQGMNSIKSEIFEFESNAYKERTRLINLYDDLDIKHLELTELDLELTNSSGSTGSSSGDEKKFRRIRAAEAKIRRILLELETYQFNHITFSQYFNEDDTVDLAIQKLVSAGNIVGDQISEAEKNYEGHKERADKLRDKLSETDFIETDAVSIISSAVTRFGLIIVLIFFAQALINLYRYLIQLSSLYWSRAMAIALSNGDLTMIADLSNNFSPQGLSFGRIPKATVDDVVKILEKIQVSKK